MRFKPRSRPATPAAGGVDHEAVFREARREQLARSRGYRERSLALHGWMLTVHHRDGKHDRNPPDGSNWENLCVDCHDAEHAVGLLGDYLTGRARRR